MKKVDPRVVAEFVSMNDPKEILKRNIEETLEGYGPGRYKWESIVKSIANFLVKPLEMTTVINNFNQYRLLSLMLFNTEWDKVVKYYFELENIKPPKLDMTKSSGLPFSLIDRETPTHKEVEELAIEVFYDYFTRSLIKKNPEITPEECVEKFRKLLMALYYNSFKQYRRHRHAWELIRSALDTLDWKYILRNAQTWIKNHEKSMKKVTRREDEEEVPGVDTSTYRRIGTTRYSRSTYSKYRTSRRYR